MFGFGVSDLHLLMHRLRIVCISRTAFQALAPHLCGPKIYPWIEILGNFWSFCIFNFWTWQVIRTNQWKLHLQKRFKIMNRHVKNKCCEVRLRRHGYQKKDQDIGTVLHSAERTLKGIFLNNITCNLERHMGPVCCLLGCLLTYFGKPCIYNYVHPCTF